MVPNTPYTANSLFSPSEENLKHEGTGWGRTKSAAANPCCLFQISSSVYRCCWHGCHQSFVQVFLIPWFLIFLINRTCRRSNHNHVQCFVCFRNWLIIIEHVLWNLFCLRPKFSNIDLLPSIQYNPYSWKE